MSEHLSGSLPDFDRLGPLGDMSRNGLVLHHSDFDMPSWASWECKILHQNKVDGVLVPSCTSYE
jgi:hypothetical protein